MAIKIDIDRTRGLTFQKGPGVERRHSKSDDYSKDINDFLDIVSDGWADFQKRYSIPEAKRVSIKYINPKELIESPDIQDNVILFKLISRKRFNTSSSGSRRPRKPELREQVADPDDDNNKVSILAEKRENIVQFEIWSKHSKKANQIALQFEGFMQAYTVYFESKGINRVWFEERTEDRVVEISATEWSVRPIQYEVTTELISKKIDRKLGTITVRHDSGSKLKTTEVNTETGRIEYSIDRGKSD